MIQEQAESVPQFQSRISQLETELHQYRWSAGAGLTNTNIYLKSLNNSTYPDLMYFLNIWESSPLLPPSDPTAPACLTPPINRK